MSALGGRVGKAQTLQPNFSPSRSHNMLPLSCFRRKQRSESKWSWDYVERPGGIFPWDMRNTSLVERRILFYIQCQSSPLRLDITDISLQGNYCYTMHPGTKQTLIVLFEAFFGPCYDWKFDGDVKEEEELKQCQLILRGSLGLRGTCNKTWYLGPWLGEEAQGWAHWPQEQISMAKQVASLLGNKKLAGTQAVLHHWSSPWEPAAAQGKGQIVIRSQDRRSWLGATPPHSWLNLCV